MLVATYSVNDRVGFSIRDSEESVGKIIEIEDKAKPLKFKRTHKIFEKNKPGYKIRIEKPRELRNQIVYIPQGFIKNKII